MKTVVPEAATSDLRYPLGPFDVEAEMRRHDRRELLRQMAGASGTLRAATAGLTPSQLDTPYRPGGWTVRQVVHHLTDSHVNWYVRTKLALTESEPTIKPFDGDRWSELKDAREGPLEPSLLLIEGLHARWVQLFESLTPADWSRRLFHPERGWMVLETTLPMHAWHVRHHAAQITELRKRLGWSS
jgi:hypothetical protein